MSMVEKRPLVKTEKVKDRILLLFFYSNTIDF